MQAIVVRKSRGARPQPLYPSKGGRSSASNHRYHYQDCSASNRRSLHRYPYLVGYTGKRSSLLPKPNFTRRQGTNLTPDLPEPQFYATSKHKADLQTLPKLIFTRHQRTNPTSRPSRRIISLYVYMHRAPARCKPRLLEASEVGGSRRSREGWQGEGCKRNRGRRRRGRRTSRTMTGG